MRDAIQGALTDAQKSQDKCRTSTLRLVCAAMKDRDIAQRTAGKSPLSNAEILELLQKMVKQREESAITYENAGRLELADQERREIEVIRDFLPQPLADDAVRDAVADVIRETSAASVRDMGKCMAALKSKYPGQMDFGKASGVVKEMLG